VPAGRPVEAGEGPPAEERILAATLHALARLDPGALTIQAICRDAGVTPPTLYYHFGSKDGLVAAAIERLADDWTSLLDVTVPRRGDLDETLATAERGWAAMVLSPGRPLAVIAWVTLLSAQTSERARTALVRARERTVQLTAEAIQPHVGDAEQAGDLAAVVIDGVVAAALDHHLDGDVPALHRRLSALMRVVRVVVAQSQTTAAGA
jgi:AcrR family transcriptional regulator